MTTATTAAPTTTSAARAEANRRNAQKSTGPRTPTGKDRSRFNALKHGMRAQLPILPGEDEDIRRRRQESWIETLAPRDDVERYLVERAVNVSWQLDRADRAWAARMTADLLSAAAGQADAQADSVVLLGRRLFWDPRGPMCLYPHYEATLGDPIRASWSPDLNDLNDPAAVVPQLESTALGCVWLLDRWGELGELLEDNLLWQAPDRFKTIRLLGRQPLEATDDDRVMAIYLACHAMDAESTHPFADVSIELAAGERKRFAARVEARLPRMTALTDPGAGRQLLVDLVAEQSGRLEQLLTAHIEREAAAEEARLGFEDTNEGERLRRHQLSCSRMLLRILETIRRRHRDADGPPPRTRKKAADPTARPGDLPPAPAELAPAIAETGNATNEPIAPEDRSTTSQPSAPVARLSSNELNAPVARIPSNELNAPVARIPSNESNAPVARISANESNAPVARISANEPNAPVTRVSANEPNAPVGAPHRSTLSPIVLALALLLSMIVATPAAGASNREPGPVAGRTDWGREDLTTKSTKSTKGPMGAEPPTIGTSLPFRPFRAFRG